MKFYVKRKDSIITSYSKWPATEDPETEERMSDDHPDLVAFIESQSAKPTNQELIDQLMGSSSGMFKAVKAIVLCTLEGTVAQGVTPQAAKTAILAKM